ncbi:MAG TPA: hypothetical protein VKZ85_04395 [Woeseiaceae bacterium]|nr:hypothetical protein [Woeseiaceae bacterium]
MIWFAFALMMLSAMLFVAWPLRVASHGRGLIVAVATVLIVSSAVYLNTGTPFAPEAAGTSDSMVRLLKQRAAEHPGDAEAWKMLGRSLLAAEDYAGAIPALERAVELESAKDAETLVDLGEAVLNADERTITGRAGELFEKALALDPWNPRALFFGGVAAIARGERSLAADRWESLLDRSPPPELEPVIRQRVSEWRGAPGE